MTKIRPALKMVWNLFLITAGSLLCAVSINGILVPNQFLAGGVSGLSLFIYYLFPFMPVGVTNFLLNIPLFVVGWVFVGRRFFYYSLAGMTIFSLALLAPVPAFPIRDPLLNALTAGIISGVGSGVILKSLGSGGGLDILSVILLKRFSIRIGTTVMAFNCTLMLACLFRFNLEIVLYTLIYLFVTTQLINLVVTGLNQRKAVMVVSPKWQEIAREIMDTMQRGVTIVNGEGGYTGQEQRILYSVITFQELSRFKEMVQQQDPEAFMVVAETLEVMGKGIGNQPHW
ncbi:MAG: YitT family protein [Hyphomicrobiales bacterium]